MQIKKIFFIFSIFVSILSISFTIYNFLLDPKNTLISPTVLFIDKGDRVIRISESLKQLDIVKKNVPIRLILTVLLYKKNIRYGEYEILPHERLSTVVSRILKGQIYLRKLIIPSGFTKQEIFKIIDDNEYLLGTFDKSLINEGRIFSDTYLYSRGDFKQKLINKMTDLMAQNLWSEWLQRDKDLPYKSMFEGLILASIIEKEAFYYDDKRKVASVFLNRLKIGQKLQSNPTVQYSVDMYFGIKTRLQKSFFSVQSFWNTYYINGLPLTAISNPSMESIRAAFHPENTDYYYFISIPSKTDNKKLIFNKTFQDHLQYVQALPYPNE